MDRSLQIRRAEKVDIPAILELYAQPDIDDGQLLSIENAEKIFAKIASYPNYSLYVAEISNTIAGSFALLIMDNLGHLGAPSAIVEDFVVAPSVQRKGIGRKMIEHAVILARDSKCYKLTLSANLKRETAHAFYTSLGFTKHGYSFSIEL